MKVSKQFPFIFVWIFLLGFGLLFGACGPAFSSNEQPTPTPIPTAIIPLKPTYEVQRGEVVNVLRFSGRVGPVIEEELFFRVGGRVNTVYVEKGDQVTAGQLLADLDAPVTSYDLRRAEIHLEIAKLRLMQAELEISPSTEVYTTSIAILGYDVELAQIALDELKSIIADTKIFAPIDGTVLTISMNEGSLVDAYKPVIVITDLTQLEILSNLPDSQLSLMVEGLEVIVNPVGKPGENLVGFVKQLPYPYGKLTGNSNQKNDNFTHISLDTSIREAGYELGDLVNVTAVLERRGDVLWLPPQAIRTFEGRKFVVTIENGGQRRVDVKLGIRSEDRVEILSGLAAGQIVIAP